MQNNRLADIKAIAYGQWYGIHQSLGVSSQLLNGKHQPCPYCGGKDRFRYTNYQQGGGFICNQCTPQGGSGFDLLMLVFGYDFQTALEQVASVLGLSQQQATTGYTPRNPLPATPIEQPDRQSQLTALWQETVAITADSPAYLYLRERGLPTKSIEQANAIRYMPALPYYAIRDNGSRQAAPILLGDFPAIIAAITNNQGDLMGLHKTYLQHNPAPQKWHKLSITHPDTGDHLPAKKMNTRYNGALKGTAVHLHQPDEQGRLIVAEGIETALAANALFNLPSVAALSSWGMGVFEPPDNCTQLFIVADNDPNQAGFKAAHQLAINAIKSGIEAHIWQPETIGYDALDELNKRVNNGQHSN